MIDGWRNLETWNMATWLETERARWDERFPIPPKDWDAESLKKFMVDSFPYSTPEEAVDWVAIANWLNHT